MIIICKGCCQPKDESLFRLYKGKRKPRCRECENKYLREYRSGERRQELLQKRKIYNKLNLSTKKKQGYLKRKYNITLDIYNELCFRQNKVCAVCKNPETIDNKSLAVDHDHETGKIRGLLCQKCNVALGLFQDNPIILQRAIKYLKKKND